jgi:hypothetical protein
MIMHEKIPLEDMSVIAVIQHNPIHTLEQHFPNELDELIGSIRTERIRKLAEVVLGRQTIDVLSSDDRQWAEDILKYKKKNHVDKETYVPKKQVI